MTKIAISMVKVIEETFIYEVSGAAYKPWSVLITIWYRIKEIPKTS